MLRLENDSIGFVEPKLLKKRIYQNSRLKLPSNFFFPICLRGCNNLEERGTYPSISEIEKFDYEG
jgi:hypothetical protein